MSNNYIFFGVVIALTLGLVYSIIWVWLYHRGWVYYIQRTCDGKRVRGWIKERYNHTPMLTTRTIHAVRMELRTK